MTSNRTIWVCRHAERIDNIDSKWRRTSRAWDDPPLSARGLIQAAEVAIRLKDEPIHHIVSSPFERCIQTAQIIASGHSHTSHCINVDHGICESLYLCQNPPGWLPLHELKAKYPIVNEKYEPMLETLPRKEPRADDGCVARVKETLKKLLKQYEGNILLVGHGSSVGAIHEVLADSWTYVGQCTLSKFVQQDDGRFKRELNGDATHLSDLSNLRAY